MKCKKCKREVQKDFVFCPYCSYRLIPDATEIKVPVPSRNAKGGFTQQVMFEGKRYTVTAPTLDEYKAKAREIKAGIVPVPEEDVPFVSLCEVIDAYLDRRGSKLSARTVYNYEAIRDKALGDAGVCSIHVIDWQALADHLLKTYSAGHVKTTFALIKVAMKDQGYLLPKIELPTPNSRDGFLDDEQIKKLLAYARGKPEEAAVILFLHSLRRSEALALNSEDIYDGVIHVNKIYVKGKDGYFHIENKTKTEKSTREIPVLYSRLYECIPPSGKIIPISPSAITNRIKALCRNAGLPECSPHDLRRSFASLCNSLGVPEKRMMSFGGWSSPKVMNDVYVKLYEKDSGKDAQPLKDFFNFTSDASDSQ